MRRYGREVLRRARHLSYNSRSCRALGFASWPFAGDGFGGKCIVHEGGSGSRPPAGPAAREALAETAGAGGLEGLTQENKEIDEL